MQINLIAVGNKMPQWIQEGYHEYAQRMPRECRLALKEIDAGKRSKNYDRNRLIKKEGERILASIPTGAHVVALELTGIIWDTEKLSQNLARWRIESQHIALLIGGPEGLALECLSRAHQTWSLSNLTFPHALVRVIVAEQLYRAWTILCNHPYHK